MSKYNGIAQQIRLALCRDKGYSYVLSKTNSGRAYRNKLAFYLSTARIAPQNNSIYLDTAPKAYKNASRGQTLIKASNLPNDYDGTTSLNKIAERRISGAAAICAESEPRHPIRLPYGVTPTQKQIGAIYLG